MITPLESDWKLFRQRIPQWQERYMEKLCDEYAAILTGEKRGSDAFWEVQKRTRRDQKSPGVVAEMKRSNMYMILLGLFRDGVIGPQDLDGFSEDLAETMRYFYNEYYAPETEKHE